MHQFQFYMSLNRPLDSIKGFFTARSLPTMILSTTSITTEETKKNWVLEEYGEDNVNIQSPLFSLTENDIKNFIEEFFAFHQTFSSPCSYENTRIHIVVTPNDFQEFLTPTGVDIYRQKKENITFFIPWDEITTRRIYECLELVLGFCMPTKNPGPRHVHGPILPLRPMQSVMIKTLYDNSDFLIQEHMYFTIAGKYECSEIKVHSRKHSLMPIEADILPEPSYKSTITLLTNKKEL